MRRMAGIAVGLWVGAGWAQAPLLLEGELSDDGAAFVRVPFEVPAGIAELEVRHDDLSAENILDFGLEGPEGFRGWGGGNDEPAVVGEHAASRSYLKGPLRAGTWQVVIGKARVLSRPARYRVEVLFRAAPNLAAQPERRPYVEAKPLSTQARWYAGDLHVHSKESGDARPTLDEVASFARARGLDFVALSEHNTVSQLDFYADVQARHPELLLVPSVEFTTYAGHANGIGATRYVDHRLGLDGASLEGALLAFGEQGAVVSINHPVLDLGQSCIGCPWKLGFPDKGVGAIEIATGGWDKTGVLFTKKAIAYWDAQLGKGHRLAALGGSDDHKAGVGLDSFQSPIGAPTTLVYAETLSASAIVEGIRRGRTVVKLQGPEDPMVDLVAGQGRVGDTLRLDEVTLVAKVQGGSGAELRWVHNGAAAEVVPIETAELTATRRVRAPPVGQVDRHRAEVWIDGAPRTVTSHLYVEAPRGCGCQGTGSARLLLLLAALAPRRRLRIS